MTRPKRVVTKRAVLIGIALCEAALVVLDVWLIVSEERREHHA